MSCAILLSYRGVYQICAVPASHEKPSTNRSSSMSCEKQFVPHDERIVYCSEAYASHTVVWLIPAQWLPLTAAIAVASTTRCLTRRPPGAVLAHTPDTIPSIQLARTSLEISSRAPRPLGPTQRTSPRRRRLELPAATTTLQPSRRYGRSRFGRRALPLRLVTQASGHLHEARRRVQAPLTPAAGRVSSLLPTTVVMQTAPVTGTT
jgi:hypothetical protein